MKKYVLGFCLLFLFVSVVNAQKKIEVEKLSDRITVVKLMDERGEALNVSAITTKSGVIVIDTGFPLADAKNAYEKIIEVLGREDFIYVINTHGHMDHSIGNQYYKGAMVVGHHLNSDVMKENVKSWNPVYFPDEFEITLPGITFSDRMKLYVDDITVEVVNPGSFHLESHGLVYIPEDKVLFTGDTLDGTYLPYIEENSDVQKMIRTLDYLFAQNGIEKVVGGHRIVYSGEQLKAYLTYMKALWAGVENAKREGRTLEQAKPQLLKDVRLKGYDHVRRNDESYIRNIEAVWKIQTKN